MIDLKPTNSSPTSIWNAVDVAVATGGRARGGLWEASGVSIDSRTLKPGDLFIALIGPNHDGHDHIQSALDKGACAIIASHLPSLRDDEIPAIIVNNTKKALTDLAKTARERTRAKIIAITGSVGKTGTKEMIASALSKAGSVISTLGNQNNQIGVPLSVSRLPKDCDFGVFEAGMNTPGEILELTKIIRPHVALITTVTEAHTEFFQNIEQVAYEKGEVFRGLEKGGTALINRDSPFFFQLLEQAKHSNANQIISFGKNPKADCRLVNWDTSSSGTSINAIIADRNLNYKINLQGEHWAINSIAAIGASIAAGGCQEKVIEGLTELMPIEGRGQIYQVEFDNKIIEIIDESYNASPASMKAALECLGQKTTPADTRRVAILGDMLELGLNTNQSHAELAQTCQSAGIDIVHTVGQLMANLYLALPGSIQGEHFPSAEKIKASLNLIIKNGDTILIKGSQGMRMRQVLNALVSANEHRKACGD